MHDHDDRPLHGELVLDGFADKLQGVVERNVARRDHRDDRHAQRPAASGIVVRPRVGEVVGVLARRSRLHANGLGRLEDEVETALLNRTRRIVKVLRCAAEVLYGVDDRRRRLERNRGEAHGLHALYDLLLDGAFSIVGILYDRLALLLFAGGGVDGVGRTPRLVDVGNPLLAGNVAFLLEDDVAFADDGIPETKGLLVVGILYEDEFALVEGKVELALRKKLAGALQVTALRFAAGLVVGFVAAMRNLRDIRLVGIWVYGVVPRLELAACLRVTKVNGLLHQLLGTRATACAILFKGGPVKTFGDALGAFCLVDLRFLAVVQELHGNAIMTNCLGILAARQGGARLADLAHGLGIHGLAAQPLDCQYLVDELTVLALKQGSVL